MYFLYHFQVQTSSNTHVQVTFCFCDKTLVIILEGYESMMAGSHGNRKWSKLQNTKSSHLQPEVGNRQSKLKMTCIFKLSKPIPSGILSSTNPHLFSLPNSTSNQAPAIQMSEIIGDISFRLLQHAFYMVWVCLFVYLFCCCCCCFCFVVFCF